MTTLLTLVLITFFSLFFYVIYKFGFISSWSEMYYKLKKQGWIFQVVMVFLGIAPRFSFVDGLELEREVHFFAAKLSGVASIVWIILMAIYVTPILALSIPISSIICYAAYKIFGREIWWIEMAAFFSVFMVFGYLIY